LESLHGHTDAAKIKDIALKSERVPETPEARLNRLVLDHFLNRLLEENACLAARLKAQSAEPHRQQENNVVRSPPSEPMIAPRGTTSTAAGAQS
jgi:hypothetical protein